MRITHDMLLKVANDAVARRVRESRALMAAYLCGSLLGEEYLLGGTADVDLVFIYTDQPPAAREVQRLTDEVHLDIAHHYHRDYSQTRRLRVHPWLGPALNACKALYDPQHLLDFTQASVRGQFDRPDHAIERVRQLLEHARQIWFSYQAGLAAPAPADIEAYLRAVEHAANAVASLSGPPLTDRRLLSAFPARAAAVGRPGLYQGLLGLLGAPNLPPGGLVEWLPLWQEAYLSIPAATVPVRLSPLRLPYYRSALDAHLASPHPEAALWPMLRTWTLAAGLCSPDSRASQGWAWAFTQLGLAGAGFMDRMAALDAYLDLVDETLEDWARRNGA